MLRKPTGAGGGRLAFWKRHEGGTCQLRNELPHAYFVPDIKRPGPSVTLSRLGLHIASRQSSEPPAAGTANHTEPAGAAGIAGAASAAGAAGAADVSAVSGAAGAV